MKNLMFLICLLPMFVTAQVNIGGTVSHNNEPVDFANVVVKNTAKEFVTGTVTNNQGQFDFTLENGSFQLSISHLNFESKDTSIQIIDGELVGGSHLLNFKLTNSAQNLEEVVVSASKKVITRKIDRTVMDISDNAMLSSGNAHEAMQSAPGLAISNESIVMLGKSNVSVAIDGRIIQLTGEELNSYLKSLPASEIQAIEVISNPPARYQAEGNSGIVNLVTKRLKKDMWRNNASLSHSQAKFGWQNFNNNFAFRKNKISFTSNIATQIGHQEFVQFVEPAYTLNPQKTTSVQKRNVKNISPRFILDYKLNPQTTIGVQYLQNINQVRQWDDLETIVFNTEKEIESYQIADDVEYFHNQNNTSYNFFLDRQLDTTGGKLIFNLDFLDYKGNTQTKLFSNIYDQNRNFESIDFANQGEALNDIANYSASLDLEHLLSGVKFSYGAASNFTLTNYRLKNFNIINEETVLRKETSNHFEFKENIVAAYINGYRRLSDKWEAQVGLRAEYIDVKGISLDEAASDDLFASDYFKLFPTVYLSYNHNENNSFSLNYGKRISRPTYNQLNPARSFLSGQSSQQGNPFLRPSFTHNLEFSHTFKAAFYSTLNLRRTEYAYSFFFELNDETQEQLITYKNLFNEQALSITSSYDFNPLPNWKSQAFIYSGIGSSEKLSEEDQILLKNSARLYLSSNNQIHLNRSKTFTGQINVWFDSAYDQNIYSFGEAYSLDVALTAKDLIPGLTMTLGAYDIFNSSPRDVFSNVNGVNHRFKAYPSNRYVRLHLAYKFGNDKIKHQNRQFGNENIRGRSN